MMRYYVSLRVYDEDDDYYGVEWKLTRAQYKEFLQCIENKYGKGSEL